MIDFFVNQGSYLGIFVFMVLTGAGLPLPEEVAIVGAGILCSHGTLNPGFAFAALLAGGLVGDCLMYYIGHHFGRAVIREHRWWAHFMTPEREAQVEVMLHNHGLKVLFIARFLVGLRSPVYISAGILRLPFRRFLLFDLLCATTAIGVFFGLSYYFGQWITDWIVKVERGLAVGAVLAVAILAVYYWRRHRRKRAAAVEKVDLDVEHSCEIDQPQETPGEMEHIA